MSILSYLLLLFSVFVYSLLQLCMLSVDVTEMRGLLSFSFLVIVFAVVVKLSLFLVMQLFLQLYTSLIEIPRMRRLPTFSTFILIVIVLQPFFKCLCYYLLEDMSLYYCLQKNIACTLQ